MLPSIMFWSYQTIIYWCVLFLTPCYSVFSFDLDRKFLIVVFCYWHQATECSVVFLTLGYYLFFSKIALAKDLRQPYNTNFTVPANTAFLCTKLYYTALHSTALHCNAPKCISWKEKNSTALHCIALPWIALCLTTLRCISLNCTASHCIALHCTTLHWTV